MPAPILASKLFMPQPRANGVERARLLLQLDEGWREGAGPALTLVSAPAGFGKTTLIAAWAARSGRQVAWLSLDPEDGDPPRFLMYLSAALRRADPDCGSDAMAALQAPQPPATEEILSDLVNELDGGGRDILLVLDDYHEIDSPRVDAALAFLLERLPERLRIAVATREDPNLPLASLRARNELRELRAADLRFTPEEAAEFLGGTMGLDLEAEQVAALESKTEGWISGLQLAAISLRGREDPSEFITSFAGSHRFVLDYLIEEVVRRQAPEVQDFLLMTSVLDRFCAPLCDALAEHAAARGIGVGRGRETLESLERGNLFIVPLDDERRWYRYHHLFGELLLHRLEADGRFSSPELRLCASRWCEEAGLPIEAFQYAARAGDIDRAAALGWGRAMPKHFRGGVVPVLEWLGSLPAEAFRTRPALSLMAAALSLVAGRAAGVGELLEAAERGLAKAPPGDPRTSAIAGRVAAVRSTLALTKYRPDEIMEQSRRALELLPAEDLGFRFTACWTRAFAAQLYDDRAESGRLYAQSLAIARESGDAFSLQLAYQGEGDACLWANRLDAAAERYRKSLELYGEQPLPSASDAHLGLAQVSYERNELDAAEEAGERSLALARRYDETIDRWVVCEIFLSRVLLARGLAAEADARLESLARRAAARGFDHRLGEISAQRGLVRLGLGDLLSAERLAAAARSPRLEARLLLARGRAEDALAAFAAERRRLEAKGWMDEPLRIRVLEALALRELGRNPEALAILESTLRETEVEGFLRLYLDEGEAMERLLAELAGRGSEDEGARRVLSAFSKEAGSRHGRSAGGPAALGTAAAGSAATGAAVPRPALVDPLSERELEVLRLVSLGLSNQEIGDRLFIALDTVKGHNRRIFEKLDAKRRTEAIARARELGFL